MERDDTGIISREGWKQIRDSFELTKRQFDIARLICRAYSNKEIADYLEITPHTVHVHVRDIFRKVGTDSRLATVIEFVRVDRRLQLRCPAREREVDEAPLRGLREAPVAVGD